MGHAVILDSLMVKIALIGALGIGAQWVAWKTGRPAIALMLIVGVLAGPVLGIINPQADFGALLDPIIKLAVAVILFEGGLSLNFKDLRHAGWAVMRLVFIGVPVGWALGTAAAYFGAGLSLEVSALFGGILVVTGPTVIGPMLRNLRVGARVRDILKWEGIINDPIGALLAVAIYAYITYEGASANVTTIAFDVLGASFLAGLIGGVFGFGLTWLFLRGYIPEYLKAPILLITVIAGFVMADIIMHETGLITVTVMGIVMANRHVYSSRALHRFKEDLAVLLISGVFILLSAQLDWETVLKFQAQFVIFLFLLLFVVRPITVFTSLMFSSVPWKERVFIGWIAPRGIVAVAITGLFAIRLVNSGFEDAEALVPLSFAVVIVTIFAHGFSAGWLADHLGLDEGKGEAIMIVGANRWGLELGSFLADQGYDVTVSDQSKFALREARQRDLDVHHGDILEEALDDAVDLGEFQHMIVATDNDSYNQLICSDLGPEFGYDLISTVAVDPSGQRRALRGRTLLENGTSYGDLVDRAREGWTFSKTRLTDKFTMEHFRANLQENEEPVAILKPDRRVLFFASEARPIVEAGDQIVSFVAPEHPAKPKPAKTRNNNPQDGGDKDQSGEPEPQTT